MSVHTIRIDPVRSSDPNIRRMVSELRDRVIADCYERVPRSSDRLKLYTAIKTLVLLLYTAHSISPDCCLSVPRDNALYSPDSRLGRLHFSRDITVRVIDWLVEQGYAVLEKKGVKFGKSEEEDKLTGYTSSYKPTAKLSALVRNEKIKLSDFEVQDIRELVELRNAEGKSVRYSATPLTLRSEELLTDYNQLLEESYIDWDELITGDPENPPNRCSKKVRRIFKCDFEHGGRFYGGWWQNLAQRDKVDDPYADAAYIDNDRRPHLYINGRNTAELDFRAIHPTLLYAIAGVDFRPYAIRQGNSYDLYGTVRFSADPVKDRALTKLAFLIGINAESDESAYRALRQAVATDRNKYPHLADKLTNEVMRGVFDAIYKAHPALNGYFGTGIGTTLQYYDSQIAERVLYKFTYELRSPCLSIHDSFIVITEQVDDLARAMHEAFIDVIRELNAANTHDYKIPDIISAEKSLDTRHIPLGEFLTDQEYEERLSKLDADCEELLIAAAGGYGEENMIRPIERRHRRWVEEGNTLPFDPIS